MRKSNTHPGASPGAAQAAFADAAPTGGSAKPLARWRDGRHAPHQAQTWPISA